MQERRTTVGLLREALAVHGDDTEVTFGGLEYLRVKLRAPGLVQIEFSQTITRDSQGNVEVRNPPR